MPELLSEKRCSDCGKLKNLWAFARDRSRPDGRWHTCKLCNREYARTRGKILQMRRQFDRKTKQGLRGLRQYPHGGERFDSIPPERRSTAEQLLSKYLCRHAHEMTPALYASLHGTAASNARRVGNRSWARSMWRKKGWRRAVRKRDEQQAEPHTPKQFAARVRYLDLGLD